MTLPLPDLPVCGILPELRHALAASRDVVLSAPPGSGKTTRIPLALLDERWLAGRSIMMLEPRRVAVRAAAWRMAELLGEEVGERVGYRVRLEGKESRKTRILVLSEGLLTRRILYDPDLSGVGLVIFDEFHERSLQADLAFALCREIRRGVRRDLRILVMSATLDGASLASHLEDPAVIETHGRQFPVETRFAPGPAREPLPRQVARLCLRALAERPGGVLAFLPGEGEIRSTVRCLEESPTLPPDVDLHPLYGSLAKTEQDAALRPAPARRRKLVLATSIAESSLTIDGVDTVVDSGWMRVSRFSPATGMERLETLRITRDRADQRRGRAGRLAPGVCYRLWDEATDALLVPTSLPEILTSDLAASILVLADWGVADREEVEWVTPPPEAAWRQAVALLQALGAVDEKGHVTPHGRRMVSLPMHPRLAHMVLQAATREMAETGCLVAALLAERVTVERAEGVRSTDLRDVLDAVRRGRGAAPLGRGPQDRVRTLARDWLRVVGAPHGTAAHEDVGMLLAAAFPDRIARRRGPRGDPRYLLACGRGGTLRREDPLSEQEWLVVAELDDSDADAAIRLAAPLPSGEVEALLQHQLRREAVLAWDRRRGAVVASELERMGAITLRERPSLHPDPGAVRACLCEGLRAEGLSRLPWSDSAKQLLGRLRLLHRALPEQDWPDVSEEALGAALDDWLGPAVEGMRSLEDVQRVDLAEALLDWLGHPRRSALSSLAPTHLAVPSGSRVRLDYTLGGAPVLAVRIQEVFGLAESPRIVGGRETVLLHLLSPARRPVQITSDLASFWRTGYAEVRKDLRGRYPRHHWPEDPRGFRSPPS